MTKRKFWAAALCVGSMVLAGGQALWADKLESQQWSEIRSKLQAEGWEQISEGVFERRLGTKVEHMGYGREGLAWTIGELRRQLEVVMQEYEQYPSDDLAKVIDDLSAKIAHAQQEIKYLPKAITSATAAVTGPSCSICYSATADAAHLPAGGVGANAQATFNSSCGYSGETYAYAYARATLNGTTNTVTQSDPDSGTSITSTATASASGGSIPGTTCYSSANAYAQSTALGISYSTSDVNDNYCPIPSLDVNITGTTVEFFLGTAGCRTKTWSVAITGGTAPYSYVWKYNGTVVGTGSTYSRSICRTHASFTLDVSVTDAESVNDTDSHYVEVYWEPDNGCYQQGMQVICQ